MLTFALLRNSSNLHIYKVEKNEKLTVELQRFSAVLVPTIFAVKNRLKSSTRYHDAYITQDFARAIQKERKSLIQPLELKLH